MKMLRGEKNQPQVGISSPFTGVVKGRGPRFVILVPTGRGLGCVYTQICKEINSAPVLFCLGSLKVPKLFNVM